MQNSQKQMQNLNFCYKTELKPKLLTDEADANLNEINRCCSLRSYDVIHNRFSLRSYTHNNLWKINTKT